MCIFNYYTFLHLGSIICSLHKLSPQFCKCSIKPLFLWQLLLAGWTVPFLPSVFSLIRVTSLFLPCYAPKEFHVFYPNTPGLLSHKFECLLGQTLQPTAPCTCRTEMTMPKELKRQLCHSKPEDWKQGLMLLIAALEDWPVLACHCLQTLWFSPADEAGQLMLNVLNWAKSGALVSFLYFTESTAASPLHLSALPGPA